ncbi:MAG: condensation domain-containing protein [Thermoanaerobaculia bacterium]
MRIELGEVESALTSHPAVSQAVVTLGSAGSLRALWVAAPGRGAETETLATFLRQCLPPAMVPGAFLEVPELPRTATGKIDRRRAASLVASAAGAPEAVVPPRTPAEEIVADLFREVLELPPEAPVDVRDDLFRQGGHSLLLARLVARLRDVFGVEPALREALLRPTVEGLAAFAAGPAIAEPLPQADPVAPPLSFAQESLWVAERQAPGSAWYNMPAGLRLRGPVQLAALAAALGALVARHAPLRAVFGERDGTPWQRIESAAPVQLPVVDLGALPEGAAAQARKSLARREASRSFRLGSPEAGWPLLRGLVVRTAPEDHLLVLVIHHIAGDGWSLRVVVPREIEMAYGAALEDRLEGLPGPSVSYGDFALWQRRRLTGARLDGLLRFWRARLDGLAPLELPTDRPRPAQPRHLGGVRRITVGPGLARRLAGLARDRSTTVFHVVLGVYQALLARLACSADVAVGVPHARRDRSELEGLVGLFVNTLLLPNEQPPCTPFAEHLEAVHRSAMEAYAHAELPFERVVAALSPDREALSRSPIRAFVAFDATPARPPRFPGISVELEDLASGTAKFDLSLFFEPAGEGWTGAFVYDAELFDSTTVERWARRFVDSLEVIAEAPGVLLGDLPGLGRGERFQVLRELAQAPRERIGRPTALEAVHLRVARHVVRRPDALAVRAAGTALSFGAFGRRVGCVASVLAAAGVGPGATVAVYA